MGERQRYLTLAQKRSILKFVYADKEWIEKVDNMQSKQICAIYNQLKKDGIINFDDNGNIFFRTREEAKELKKRRKEAHIGHQMTFDEWAKMQNQKEIQENRKQKEYIRNGKNE